MAWEIKVWHENLGGRARLSVEAGDNVPDEVISSLVGAYWLDEVFASDEEWTDLEDLNAFDDEESPGPQLQG
jgi:hypothetical protein